MMDIGQLLAMFQQGQMLPKGPSLWSQWQNPFAGGQIPVPKPMPMPQAPAPQLTPPAAAPALPPAMPSPVTQPKVRFRPGGPSMLGNGRGITPGVGTQLAGMQVR